MFGDRRGTVGFDLLAASPKLKSEGSSSNYSQEQKDASHFIFKE